MTAPYHVYLTCDNPDTCPHDPEPFWTRAEAEAFAAVMNAGGPMTARVAPPAESDNE